MSAIENYRRMKECVNNFRSAVNLSRGLHSDGTPDTQNDKAYRKFSENKIFSDDCQCWLHMSYGYYGSSSGYDCHPDIYRAYIIKALNYYIDDILDKAVELCEEEKRKALLECKSEIEEITKELEEEV